ncbi:MAG: hypothetical protein JWP59_4676 [Massilia sp.]|nr:hypothetical protein [Massilia sp.]
MDRIDWTRPWYDSVRPAFERLGGGDIHAAFNAAAAELALRNAAGQPIRFVPQADLPAGRAYEQFIGASGCVPTRENLHDFFNALVWLSFPRTKQQLNALQAAQIALSGVGKSRGPARDAATIFDENCALLVVRQGAGDLVDALRGHRWREAFIERRAQFGADADAQLWLFGHALMEKLAAPRKAITAHTRVVVADATYFAAPPAERRAWLDAHQAAALQNEALSTASFTPLPVLGVPGWWPEQNDEFYGDASVFRLKRAAPTKE